MIVLNGNWKEEIIEAFDNGMQLTSIFTRPSPKEVYKRCSFLEKIWEMSLTAFDSPREVQVVIDNNNRLFISFGTFSFVEFSEDPVGMKLPVKCWIHTHPFGKAYFSSTDLSTINIWKTRMLSAIVLGDNEHQLWFQNVEQMPHHTYQNTRYDGFIAKQIIGEEE